MKVYLGADHRGFNLKQKVKSWLDEKNIDSEDLGAKSYNPDDDFVQYAKNVSSNVANEKNDTYGILFCGSGVGVDIAANKFDGIRAGLALNNKQIEAARRDDNINVLAIASDFVNENQAVQMVKTFLETNYEKLERRERRINQIKKIENES